MRYAVTLERGSDDTYLAWVHDLPGCFARAPTRTAVLQKLPDEIRAFRAWAGTGDDDEVEVVVAEEISSGVAAADDTAALVAPDRASLTTEEWNDVRSLLRRSRRDLLRLLRRLDHDELAWQPPSRPRPLGREIQHVGYVELMYAMWTFDFASPDGLEDFLRWTRRAAAARMRKLARAGDAAVTAAEWSGGDAVEEWTARKAARRLAWHERLHVGLIERALAQRGRAPSDRDRRT